MRRRAPPTSLRLVPGPAPPRNTQKHTLPSIPGPAFQPLTNRQIASTRKRTNLPCLDILKLEVSPGRLQSNTPVRGPWDHSGCIPFVFDVEQVLAPPKPVVISS